MTTAALHGDPRFWLTSEADWPTAGADAEAAVGREHTMCLASRTAAGT